MEGNFSTQVSPNYSGGMRPAVEYNGVRTATLIFYSVTFLFGMFGNSLVIFVIAKYRKIRVRSVSNYYIWNLAFADELFLLTMPFYAFTSFTNEWIFGEIMCKMASVFRGCNKFASVFTLMALSIDRFLATFHNLSSFRRIPVGITVCIIIWVVSLTLNLPVWLFTETVFSNMTKRVSCRLLFPRGEELYYHQLTIYVNLVVGVAIPFVIILVFNVLLLTRVRRRMTLGSGGSNGSNQGGGPWARLFNCRGGGGRGSEPQICITAPSAQQTHVARINSSMSRVVVIIVVLFAVCQLPYHAVEYLNLVILLRTSEVESQEERRALAAGWKWMFSFSLVANNLVFLSSCCNPIIYGIFNRNYRNLYGQALCCRKADSLNNGVAGGRGAGPPRSSLVPPSQQILLRDRSPTQNNKLLATSVAC